MYVEEDCNDLLPMSIFLHMEESRPVCFTDISADLAMFLILSMRFVTVSTLLGAWKFHDILSSSDRSSFSCIIREASSLYDLLYMMRGPLFSLSVLSL